MLISKYLDADVADGSATLTGRMVARNGRLWVEAMYRDHGTVWYADSTTAAYYGIISIDNVGQPSDPFTFANQPADTFGY